MSLVIQSPDIGYATLSSGEFTDLFGRVTKVELQKKQNFKPLVVADITFYSQPVIITQHGSGSETESPIKAQDLSLAIYSLTDFQNIKFYAGTNFDYRIKVTFHDSTTWIGYVVPDQWNEAFYSPPYVNNIAWTDGLSMLKNFDFVDNTGCYQTGRNTWLNTIAHILGKTRKGCNIVDAINIVEHRAEYTEGFLATMMVEAEAFKGMNCYEVLEKLLYPLFQITYENNEYVIKRINQTKEYQRITYDWQGLNPVVTNYNPVLPLTCATTPATGRRIWVEGTQQLEILPAAKRIDFTHEYGRKDSIIPRSGFEACDFQRNGNPKGWSFSGVKKFEFNQKTVAEFVSDSLITPEYPAGQFLYTEIQPPYVKKDETFVLEVSQGFGTMGVPRKEFGTTIYYGPRGNTVQMETQDNPLYMYVGTLAPYSFFIQNPGFVLKNGDYIVFPGDRPAKQNYDYPSLPTGFEAGIYYRCRNVQFLDDPPRYRFELSEMNNPTQEVVINAADARKYFIYKLNPMYLRTELKVQVPGFVALGMSQQGEFRFGAHTPMELPVSKKRDGDFFTLAFESNPESELQAPSGIISLRIEKPRPIYQSVEAGREWGSYYIEWLRLYFKDTPERRKFERFLSNNHNLIKKVEYWFGEIYSDNDLMEIDANTILKYHNALIYNNSGSASNVEFFKFYEGEEELELSFNEIISRTLASWYVAPRFMLKGELDSRDYLCGKIMTDAATGKAYTVNSYIWNVAWCRWEVELHEIGVADIEKDKAYRAKAYSETAYSDGYN